MHMPQRDEDTIVEERPDTQRSRQTSNVRTNHRVTHQDTQVGHLHQHIEDNPIPIDMSEEYSVATEKDQQEERAVEEKPNNAKSVSEQSYKLPDKADAVRRSLGTEEGANPYSEFEDEEEQAAVGSGIVETNENYDGEGEADYDIDGYQDFHEMTDSAGETSLKHNVTPKVQAPVG